MGGTHSQNLKVESGFVQHFTMPQTFYFEMGNKSDQKKDENIKNQHALKIMSFNIANQDDHKGFSEFRARNIALEIIRSKADIVGIEEIREKIIFPKSNMLETILKELQVLQEEEFSWYSCWCPNMQYEFGGVGTKVEGLGIISRKKIHNLQHLKIELEQKAQDKNRRGLIIVDIEDYKLSLMVTHLSYIPKDQVSQLKFIRQTADNQFAAKQSMHDSNKGGWNQILLGDFNFYDDVNSAYILRNENQIGFKDAAIELNNITNTFNSQYRLDRIYFRGNQINPINILVQEQCSCSQQKQDQQNLKAGKCIHHYCSDHQSLLVEFQLTQ